MTSLYFGEMMHLPHLSLELLIREWIMLVQPELALPATQILQKRKRETQGVGLAIFARINASSSLLCPPQK